MTGSGGARTGAQAFDWHSFPHSLLIGIPSSTPAWQDTLLDLELVSLKLAS